MDEPLVQYTTAPDGVRIAYATLGEGPAMVAVMPFPWTQIEYDSRGMGLSDGPRGDFSLDAQVSDREGVADSGELGPFALVSAAGFARRGEERRSSLKRTSSPN